MKNPALFVVAAVIGLTSSIPAADQPHKIVLIAGRPSHPPGMHEFRAGCLLFQKCLAGVPGVTTVVYSNGWPAKVVDDKRVDDNSAFDGVAAILIYADGGGGHPAIQGDRPKVLGELLKKGVGFGCAHYGVEVPKDRGGPEFLDWIGGYYENQYSCNPMWSPDYQSFPAHPVTRGVKPFATHDEWYFNMRWRSDQKGITPLLVAKPSDAVRDGPYVAPRGPYPHIQAAKGRDETMMWTFERADGGRSFGFTGGHTHKHWGDDNQRKILLNALLWIARVEVPKNGVESAVSEDDLKQNLDPKPPPKAKQ